MTDIAPIPCHVCGADAVWSGVRRRWRCVSNHVTSELWAAAHFLGPFATPSAPEPAPPPTFRSGSPLGVLDAVDLIA